jgi:hypothetical protein
MKSQPLCSGSALGSFSGRRRAKRAGLDGASTVIGDGRAGPHVSITP